MTTDSGSHGYFQIEHLVVTKYRIQSAEWRGGGGAVRASGGGVRRRKSDERGEQRSPRNILARHPPNMSAREIWREVIKGNGQALAWFEEFSINKRYRGRHL